MASLLIALLTVAMPMVQDQPTQVGAWQGSITTPGGGLTVIVRLERKADGAWSGSIDIPQQGLKAVPLEKIEVKGAAATFVIAGIPGTPTFAGDLSADRQSIAGTFSQGGANLPFTLTRVTAAQLAAASVPVSRRASHVSKREGGTYLRWHTHAAHICHRIARGRAHHRIRRAG